MGTVVKHDCVQKRNSGSCPRKGARGKKNKTGATVIKLAC